jgi:prevent-host-death family protein
VDFFKAEAAMHHKQSAAHAIFRHWSTIWSTSIAGHIMQLQSIGSYETKTHLADLLRRVRDGQGFTITQRGEPVADLVPAGTSALEAVDIKALLEAGRD